MLAALKQKALRHARRSDETWSNDRTTVRLRPFDGHEVETAKGSCSQARAEPAPPLSLSGEPLCRDWLPQPHELPNWTDLRRRAHLRPLSWRWLRAAKLRHAGRKPRRHPDDEHLLLICRFQDLLAACTDDNGLLRMQQDSPALFDAWSLHHREQPSLQAELQARLLAREPDASIARKLAMHADAVTWYERVFFNVADRLESPGWVVHQVIRLHDAGRRDQLFATWKLLGFAYGPAVVDEVVFDFSPQRRPVTPAEVSATLRDDAFATLRRRAVTAIRSLSTDDPKASALIMRSYLRLLDFEHRQQQRRREHASLCPAIELNLQEFVRQTRIHEQTPWPLSLASGIDLSGGVTGTLPGLIERKCSTLEGR